MRVLVVHNFYRQPGGEDEVFAAESTLLEARGHFVSRLTLHNDSIRDRKLVQVGTSALWNKAEGRHLLQRIEETRPDIIHFHNTFPLISPAGYYVARKAGIPTVQTLHNYRLVCPSATLYRDGKVCEDCLHQFLPWPAVLHACYREDRLATATTAVMLAVHRAAGTWREKVGVYIALTEFARRKHIEGGLPADKIVVKPNFITDPGRGHGGTDFLFVGRLTEDKGVRTLLEAWRRMDGQAQLRIAGDGPLAAEVERAAQTIGGVEWLGRRPKEEVLARMKTSAALIIPSLWYEGLPMTLVEAFASGLPVIASNHGSLSTLVEDGRTGLYFRPGDSADLAAKVRQILAHPQELEQMRQAARAEYEAKYTAERNYEQLVGIYEGAIRDAKVQVLMVHNRYRFRGGEDESADVEELSLRDAGVTVGTVREDNARIRGAGVVTTALGAVWSPRSYWRIRDHLKKKRCGVVHVQNFFPLISPAVYYAARAERVPVVQSLRNYRLLCPAATFYRDGHVCEDCLGKRVPWPGIRHACYRNSYLGTSIVAGMIAIHNFLRTWTDKVNVYIALSKFSRDKFIEGGLPASKIVVKPNCLAGDPGAGEGRGGFAVFVGRLTREKGIGTLLAAWKRLDGRIPLKIVGEGPMAEAITADAAAMPGVEMMGRRTLDEVYALVGEASFLVFPTEWYETFGRVVIEAYAKGTPVIASDIGAVTELIESGRTGLMFRCGDAEDLAAKVEYLLDRPAALAAMRREARAEFEAKYMAARNGEALRQIYGLAVNGNGRS